MHLVAQLFKSSTQLDEQEFRLTNFDVQEVSVVDQPANQEDWLVIKGVNMSVQALKELFTTGAGEFRTATSKDDQAAGGGDTNAAPKIKLSEAKKQEAMQSLATVVNALVEVGKAINSAEVDEASTALPEQLTTVLRSASDALSKMVGAAAGGDATGSEEKRADAATKAKIDGFAQTLGQIEGLVDNLRQAFGGASTNVDGKTDDAGAGAGAEGSGADQLTAAMGKALTPLVEQLSKQATEITALKNSMGLPAAGSVEGRQSTQKSGDGFAWPINMNEDRRRR